MQTHNLAQGSPEWHAHRATHFNASDAPAMLGCSPYTTRTQLLRQLHTGLAPEHDAATERRFADGHRFEALARPLANEIAGQEFYPVVGSDGELSASFDGLTMGEDIAYEHKSLNDELRAVMVEGCTGADLSKVYRVQMEQQCMVSGAGKVLFMASKWEGETLVEERHCWYLPDTALRAEIVAGWKQFAYDLAAYTPPAAAAVVVAAPVQALPAVTVLVTGEIAIRDNFAAFEVAMRDFLEHRLIREPRTDQDFADLDLQIKAMKGAEAALESAEAQMLAQIQTVDTAKKTKDMLAKLVRDNRLMAEKLLASEKDRRRSEIVAGAAVALKSHIDALNRRLGKPYLPATTGVADFGGALKGLKSLASMEDKVATVLAGAKISANEEADRISLNLAALGEWLEFAHLFPDTAAIVLKAPEDCRSTIDSRIAAHQAAEAAKEVAQRERIRQEEVAKLQREQEAKDRELARIAALAVEAAKPAPTPAPAPVAVVQNVVLLRQAAESTATIRLGQIGERLGFTLTAEFVGSLGFHPVATDKSAKLYAESSFDLICEALIAHVRTVQSNQLLAA